MKARDLVGFGALATLFAGALVGVPRRLPVPPGSEPVFVREKTRFPRVVVLGIDGLDPEILEETIALYPERMQNFARLVREQGVHPLGTSTPPQSPVAWSNFITGLGPGGHGIYDFLHRDRATRMPIPSTSVTGHAGALELFGDWKLPTGGASKSNRSGTPFWVTLADHGVPADVWRMPANFPVEPAEGWSFSGMMTPAIDSAYGKCTLYTTNPDVEALVGEARVVALTLYDGEAGEQKANAHIPGPPNSFKNGDPATSVPLRIFVDRTAKAAVLDVDGQVLVLEPGEWSEFVPVSFDLLPLGMTSVGGIVRFYLRSLEPEFELYSSPVNIDPSNPIAPISAPASASAELADRRHGIGPFYTQGMPEDVNALKSEVISVPEFMQQAGIVQDEGERMLDFALQRYMAKRDGGLLFFYFSGVDLCGHMMWRHADEHHPHHDPRFAALDSSAWSKRPGSTWKDVIHDLYMELDPVVGRLREKIGESTTLIVMSDHGFAPYGRRFSLNTWLLNEGYLVLKEGHAKELSEDDPARKDVSIYTFAGNVDWSKTRAYGIGFNGLYLNLAGREQDDPATADDESGIVDAQQAPALLAELKARLELLRDGDTQVVVRADLASTTYTGARVAEAPDILVGYNSNYGNSDEASLGRIPDYVLSDNDRGGTFNGSHLMVPDVVFGALLSNRPVAPGARGLEDVTVEVLHQYGIPPGPGMQGRPVLDPTSH